MLMFHCARSYAGIASSPAANIHPLPSFGAGLSGPSAYRMYRDDRPVLRGHDLLQNLFGEGVLSASFIPVYARLLANNDKEEARRCYARAEETAKSTQPNAELRRFQAEARDVAQERSLQQAER